MTTTILNGAELWQAGSPLYSKLETAAVLRVAEGKDNEARMAAVDRLVDRKALMPTLFSGKRFFSRDSIQKCIERLTTGEAA